MMLTDTKTIKRTLVIGDIHGGLKALKQVLKRAEVKHFQCIFFNLKYLKSNLR